ncbi:hypothetical protein ACOME3_006593 [Neoechinorhynchus agilis]
MHTIHFFIYRHQSEILNNLNHETEMFLKKLRSTSKTEYRGISMTPDLVTQAHLLFLSECSRLIETPMEMTVAMSLSSQLVAYSTEQKYDMDKETAIISEFNRIVHLLSQ